MRLIHRESEAHGGLVRNRLVRIARSIAQVICLEIICLKECRFRYEDRNDSS
jgi:hypothetical protein